MERVAESIIKKPLKMAKILHDSLQYFKFNILPKKLMAAERKRVMEFTKPRYLQKP